MIHVFKQDKDGAWKDELGRPYAIQTCTQAEARIYTLNGWHYSLDEAMNTKALEAPEKPQDNEGGEDMSEYEAALREEIKALGGKPAGRSKIETLEKQRDELLEKVE